VIRILVGANNEIVYVLRAAQNRKPVEWRVPKNSHANDRALFYIRNGFLARGVIAAEPRRNELGQYVTNVRDVVLLATVVPLAFIHENHSSWKWLNAKMKSYTTIDGTIEARLDGLLTEYNSSFAEPLTEGTSKVVSVTVYERNPLARHQCIAHYGTDCYACGFSFGEMYGKAAEGYIHVHHLKAVANRGGPYTVDPIKDLRPICPNCHAVVHMQTPPLTILELKQRLKAARSTQS
jgi:hypothetical protein